jgi:glycine/D-amino acid oxidase-like deaminating enzyme
LICDVAIVGAGIVGAACAAECARAGMRVTVIEPGIIGGGATAAGMGHIVVMDDSEAQFALTRLSRDLWIELAPDLPKSVEVVPCGTLWVAADEEEMREVQRKHDFYAARGVSTEILDARQLHEAEPNLRAGLAGALLVSQDSVVYPPCAALELIKTSGAKVVSARAVAIESEKVVLESGAAIQAGAVINAAGIHAGALMPSIPVSIAPRKGHLLITDRYPGFVRHQLVELGYLKSAHSTTSSSVAFNVQPRPTGQLLIGSSRQFGTDYPEIDSSMMASMLQRVTEYMPGIARLSAIRGWTGFRAATPDKLPLIGSCPGLTNTYIAAGHEGLGITTSLGTARILVDYMTGKTPPIPIAPYLPDRHA